MEKTTVHTVHVADLATALYEAFALNTKAVNSCPDTQIRCGPHSLSGGALESGEAHAQGQVKWRGDCYMLAVASAALMSR
jgi:hypothetical protein